MLSSPWTTAIFRAGGVYFLHYKSGTCHLDYQICDVPILSSSPRWKVFIVVPNPREAILKWRNIHASLASSLIGAFSPSLYMDVWRLKDLWRTGVLKRRSFGVSEVKSILRLRALCTSVIRTLLKTTRKSASTTTKSVTNWGRTIRP